MTDREAIEFVVGNHIRLSKRYVVSVGTDLDFQNRVANHLDNFVSGNVRKTELERIALTFQLSNFNLAVFGYHLILPFGFVDALVCLNKRKRVLALLELRQP